MTTQRIADYYAGKTVFVTGATGFLGKVLVEKLLRCCPEINKIYLLMRPKKGQDINQRLEDFINSKLFETVHREVPKNMEKLFVIPGDIQEEQLGISQKNKKILQEECQIIFNSAACIRFDMPLRAAVKSNVLGTFSLLELTKGMKKLEVFLHISTAYCRSDVDVLEERIYSEKQRPQDLLNFIRWLDDETLNSITKKLIHPEPNTYSYTKFLAENLVTQYAGKFPIAIARPSIVIGSYKEPFPGWIEGMSGVTGFAVGGGKGVIRTAHCVGSARADIVPVDIVVNACLILAQMTALEKTKEIQVCNMTNSEKNPITWKQVVDYGQLNVIKYPFSQSLWYPCGVPQESRIIHKINVVLLHYLPAYLIDLVMLIIGKERFMVRVQRKISEGFKTLDYYIGKDWNFKNDKFQALEKRLSPEDNEIFFTNDAAFEWIPYIEEYVKGVRQFVCKEDPSTLPAARKKMTRLYYAHITVKFIGYVLLMYCIYRFLLYLMN